jgi:peptidoglycan/xylan/chitin deacetylase (PgdA/CDA1 family)
VGPRNFAQHLEILSKVARPIDLQRLVEGLIHDDLPPRAVAVTFDDGYSDTLYEVKPLLERHQIPATIFVTTGSPGRIFWWDELEAILLSPTQLPAELPDVLKDRVEGWKEGVTADAQREFLSLIYRLLLPLSAEERLHLITRLQLWVGPVDAALTVPRALNPSELLELADSGLVTIGAHTETHPLLALLSADDQIYEIRQSKTYLEGILGRPVTGFAYPNGSKSELTMNLVRESGFQYACASTSDVVSKTSDPFQLPRFWVPNCNGTAFSGWLKWWLPGTR